MRLLIATDQWSPDVVGGAARVAAETARALARRGHETVVLAPRSNGLPAVERDDGVELRRELRRSAVPQTFSDVVEGRRLARRNAAGFDVLVAHQNTLATGFAAARTNIPLALVFHSSIPLEQRFRRRRLPRTQRVALAGLGPALTVIERSAVRSAERILVLSEYSREILLREHPGAAARAVLVSGGIDSSWFEPRGTRTELRERVDVPGAAPLLLSVRRLEPRMGLEELLRAAAILRRDGLDFTLAVAGDGSLGGDLRLLARDLDLDRHVRFLGRVPEEGLRDLYAAADLSILPTVAYEGFGMATVESLAGGTPVVGTPVGATPELLTPLDPGLVAAGTEPQALATAIRTTLARLDDDFRRRCASYARSRYGWDHAIEPWEAALLELAPEGRRAG